MRKRKLLSIFVSLIVFGTMSLVVVTGLKIYKTISQNENISTISVEEKNNNDNNQTLNLSEPRSSETQITGLDNNENGIKFASSDPVLLEELKKVAIYKKWLGYPLIVFVDTFEDPQVRGLYTTSNPPKIEILRSSQGIELSRVVAHEYIHHVYANLTDFQKVTIGDIATYVYASNDDIARRMEFYTKNKNINPNEIFAISCTEYSSEEISDSMLAECNKYLLRSKLELQ